MRENGWMRWVVLGVAVNGLAAVAANSQPNVLWILTDDHRADSLRCFNRAEYGTDDSSLGYVESPTADALAKEGVLFTHAVCNSPACGPSRGSMHSGRYPFRNGHYQFEMTHQDADFVHPIVHQTIRNYGYSTGAFGKSDSYIYNYPGNTFNTDGIFGTRVHFKSDLQAKGFGDIYTHIAGKTIDGKWTTIGNQEKVMYPDGTVREYFINRNKAKLTPADIAAREQTDREFGLLRSYSRGANKTLILGGRNPQPVDQTVDAAIVYEFKSYLENADKDYTTLSGKKQQGVPSDKPFMIDIGFRLPHTPVLPPQSFRNHFKDKSYRVPEFDGAELAKMPPQMQRMYETMKVQGTTPEDVSAKRAFTAEEMQLAIRDYYAFCAYGDALIGDAVDAFKVYCAKHKQEYLIIYTVGDHGWHLGEQGIEAKFTPFRQSIHNAAIVVSSDKTQFPAGMVYDDLVEYVDFAPTILAAGGVPIHDAAYDYLDGYDLSEVVLGQVAKREYALGEMNLVVGPRAYMRSADFAFSMRTRPDNGSPKEGTLNQDVKWALTCPVEEAELALYDLRHDPLERDNVAQDQAYHELADWFRAKLGTIVLGDGRVECDWSKKNSYSISHFAPGADDKKLDIPAALIPNK